MSHYPPADIDVFATSSFSLLIQTEELEEIIPLDLHTACLIGDYDSVRAYIDTNVDLNKINVGGWTPLMYAAYVGRDNILNMLLDAGVKIDIPATRNGATALMLASYCASESIMYFLLQHGAAIDAQDMHGLTSLFHAVKQGHVSAVRLLASQGAHLDLCHYQTGMTPLMEAAMMGNEAIFGILLDHGADINRYNKNGESVRSLAMKYGHTMIVNLCDKMTFRLATGSSLRGEPELGHSNTSTEDSRSEELMDGPKKIQSMINDIKGKGVKSSNSESGFSNNSIGVNYHTPHASSGDSTRGSSGNNIRFITQPPDLFQPTIEEILHECNLQVHLEKFHAQAIDIHTFLELTDAELKEIGIEKFGPRKKIIMAIDRCKQRLKNNNQSVDPNQSDHLNAQIQELTSQLHTLSAVNRQLQGDMNAKQQQFLTYVENQNRQMEHVIFYVNDIGNSCQEATNQINKIKNFNEKTFLLLHNIKSHPNMLSLTNQISIPTSMFDDADSIKLETEMLTNRLEMTRQQVERSLLALHAIAQQTGKQFAFTP